MRSTTTWYGSLVKQLRKHWPVGAPIQLEIFCEIELGLYALKILLPDQPARMLWVLLTGYDYIPDQTLAWNERQTSIVQILRHLLPYYRSKIPWQRALTAYQSLPAHLRGYTIDDNNELFLQTIPTMGGNRWKVYEHALQHPPPHVRTQVRWGNAGSYSFAEGRKRAAVNIPSGIPLPPPPDNHPKPKDEQLGPVQVSLEQLCDTAAWMDSQLQSGNNAWYNRVKRLQFELFDTNHTTLNPARTLTLEGMVHLVGMVSSGKSTLMDVLAVFSARNGYHITLVVGDVMSALQRVDLFINLGLQAAPILGTSNRERHLTRLHRAHMGDTQSALSPSNHSGFRWLSTSCILDGLRDTAVPISINNRPCLKLSVVREDEDNDTRACPFYSACSYHQSQRDLVTATIWVATPASLIYTRVAPQIMPEHMRFAELILKRSDIVVIDEADKVQIQLDTVFSPSQNLVSRSGDAWLSRLDQHVTQQISREGRAQLVDPHVMVWCQAHDMVQLATSRVYALLLQSKLLQEAIENDYFTASMLFERLALRLSNVDSSAPNSKVAYETIMEEFTVCVNDPLGEQGEHRMADLVRRAIILSNPEQIKVDLIKWITQHHHQSNADANAIKNLAELLEFGMAVAVLSNRLDVIIRDWPQVESVLQLENAGSALFHRSPNDYFPELPVAPMDNVLALQYIRNSDDTDGPGDLRFFRCMGVGRFLLLNFNTRFALDRVNQPHVLLLSATSWSGTAPGFDIQLPVTGVLSAPKEEIDAIQKSQFEYRPILDKTGQPIRISGLRGEERLQALRSMLAQLARRSALGGLSPFEQMRNILPAGRQRLMIIVGSYHEAYQARLALDQLRPDWFGQIIHLVADDDSLESDWTGRHGIQRGMVDRFAQSDAWILIVPLLAIERGHNILNQDYKAALGAAYFLIRPHPRPDDINFAIHSINRWAVEQMHAMTSIKDATDPSMIEAKALAFRHQAAQRWSELLYLPMRYSTLPIEEHRAVTWSQLVMIWQVIGRLVRGGVEARVFFCDAAFAQLRAGLDESPGQRSTSLLISMIEILQPYFSETPGLLAEQALAQKLYGPLYTALLSMKGIDHATI